MTRALWITAALLAMTALTGTAVAQDDPGYIPEEVAAAAEEVDTGWDPSLSASANFSLASNKNVVGNVDGMTLSLGLMLNGSLKYLSTDRVHEWQNNLSWALGATRTPTVPVFGKSLDELDFETMYLIHLKKAPWFGPFVGLSLDTTLLPTDYITAEQVGIERHEIDGTVSSTHTYDAMEKIPLTPTLAPTSLRESLGVFATPLEREPIAIEIRTGVGAWETFTRNGFVIADDDTTDVLELQRLQDSVQLGAELNLTATGQFKDSVTYTARVALMQPFVHNAETELEGFELLNTEFEFLLGIRLTKWASLDYQFKAFRTPLVLDDFQIQNGLLLSVNANLI
jgi:hypothetical protein